VDVLPNGVRHQVKNARAKKKFSHQLGFSLTNHYLCRMPISPQPEHQNLHFQQISRAKMFLAFFGVLTISDERRDFSIPIQNR
jgi:hypothetical protein